MAERTSALAGYCRPGLYGQPGEPGVHLQEVPELLLHQIAAWPQTLGTVGAQVAQALGVPSAPGPGQVTTTTGGTILRVEPLKWWIHGAQAPKLTPADGSVLELSHSRTQLRVSGPEAQVCLNRLLPIDLRNDACPVGTIASTAMHHVGITVWHSKEGFELFLPRGFALSLGEVLLETALQFGVEVG